ncbi:hypothetical protein CBOM_01168 [Ceraceosorus bombacis]|uniref:Uncharacterized protein n=1 Tax=Ceraceosorus bombacis TaxID=401625 RepID=A0A0P1BCW8_9BASI|nr:hypothetical protein CBOM_01168 [Ceraceosorus bombacis]
MFLLPLRSRFCADAKHLQPSGPYAHSSPFGSPTDSTPRSLHPAIGTPNLFFAPKARQQRIYAPGRNDPGRASLLRS